MERENETEKENGEKTAEPNQEERGGETGEVEDDEVGEKKRRRVERRAKKRRRGSKLWAGSAYFWPLMLNHVSREGEKK